MRASARPVMPGGGLFGCCGPVDKPTEQPERHSWSIHRSSGRRAQLIGIVHHQPDEQAAIKLAIQQFKIPEGQRNRLIVRRLD
jgi:hypothetical protein